MSPSENAPTLALQSLALAKIPAVIDPSSPKWAAFTTGTVVTVGSGVTAGLAAAA